MEHFLAVYLIIGIIVFLACLIWESESLGTFIFYEKLKLFCIAIILWPLTLFILIDEIKLSLKE